MSQPRVAVLVFPGTNSEEETVDACRDAGMDARPILWSEPPADLRSYQAYVIPGGFAYEDRVRAGAIAAKSKSVDVVREEAARGKFVLGLCNGAQVVAEVGLLGDIAVARNLPSGHFQCRIVDIQLSSPPKCCVFTAAMAPGTVLKMAMAHGEGRFTGTPALFDRLEREGRIAFRFKDRAPNGAMHDAAGITNDRGNVLALMPHPERVAWNFNLTFARPPSRREDPRSPSHSHEIFRSMAASLA